MAKFLPPSSTSTQLSEQHTFFQYLAMNMYHGLCLPQIHSTNLLAFMSTNMLTTTHSRSLSNTLHSNVWDGTSTAFSQRLPGHPHHIPHLAQYNPLLFTPLFTPASSTCLLQMHPPCCKLRQKIQLSANL